ncbi:MAG: DUF3617 domain-containing protein [Pseudolabrys sp.]
MILRPLPAFAANEIQPGLWQDAETADINGQVYQPEIMTNCIKPEDAKDIVKAALAHQEALMMNDRPQECSKFDFKQDGDVMLFEMICRDPKEGDIDVSMTVTMTVSSPQSTSRVIQSIMRVGGQTIVNVATTESKWLSVSCDKK